MMNQNKILIQNLKGEKTNQIPFWFMRQAGRYLPEYRALRAQKNGFLNMVYDPEAASEITLQPIRRFGMDGAILFSDILVIPHALGQYVTFTAGEGPQLNPIQNQQELEKLNVENIHQTLNPIYETVKQIRQKLKNEKHDHVALIGFAGSPWTIVCYMVEGHGSRDFETVKKTAIQNPEFFQNLIDLIVSATTQYLLEQIKSGAEAIQLFDSWAGVLDEYLFQKWVIEPTQKIVTNIKKLYPDISIIGFPRGAGNFYINYARQTDMNAIGIDYGVSTAWARDNLQNLNLCVQGNLDPIHLLGDGPELEKETLKILDHLSTKPFIFNLGHGVIKETSPDTVQKLCDIIRNYKR